MNTLLNVVLILCGLLTIGGMSVARADEAGLRSSLTACQTPNSVEQQRIGGVLNCGKIWKIKDGSVRLSADGALRVNIKGLVLDDVSTGDSNGTPNGVTDVVATVICGGKIAGAAERVPRSESRSQARNSNQLRKACDPAARNMGRQDWRLACGNRLLA